MKKFTSHEWIRISFRKLVNPLNSVTSILGECQDRGFNQAFVIFYILEFDSQEAQNNLPTYEKFEHD